MREFTQLFLFERNALSSYIMFGTSKQLTLELIEELGHLFLCALWFLGPLSQRRQEIENKRVTISSSPALPRAAQFHNLIETMQLEVLRYHSSISEKK